MRMIKAEAAIVAKQHVQCFGTSRLDCTFGKLPNQLHACCKIASILTMQFHHTAYFSSTFATLGLKQLWRSAAGQVDLAYISFAGTAYTRTSNKSKDQDVGLF